MSTYKPSEHDGLKQDGTPDKRLSSDHGFGGSDGPDPHVEGQKGGSVSGTDNYKPSEHDGLTKSGEEDQRTKSTHGFGGSDGPDPHVEGQKGGSK
ncbi:uncharacterized protein I206_101668 [Kwoniella pini CBS 10737]|uniref:Uncharacterized protein n=1 Tax=Kwoniella pini CBS 10737 TaxID=1296096 RepID=A0A1B9HW16_9TREE|nr:uncharacterized protein I206_06363 [Kwoniella pini CBS 10737]OCF47462.1 hypothetical protein I206_06363 [Kwoniella pini CBS 10737]